MDYGTFYNPNIKSFSSSTPILIPSSCSTRATNTRNGKKKGNDNNNRSRSSSSSNNNNNNNNRSRSSSRNNNNNRSRSSSNNNNNNRNRSSSNNNNNLSSSSNNNNNKGGVRLSTDPQSIAARERRHRISDRFKMLQSLVPGGAKLDTVSMLDQAIQYVTFLKAQILLHEAIIKNNNNVNNFTNSNQDHINNSTTTTINDAYYYDDQYYYALMYDCNNYGSQQEGGSASDAVVESEGEFKGGFCNPQEMNTAASPAATNYQAVPDGWNYYQGNDQQSMYY